MTSKPQRDPDVSERVKGSGVPEGVATQEGHPAGDSQSPPVSRSETSASKQYSERLRALLSTTPEGEGTVILSEDECLDALDDLRRLEEQLESAREAIRLGGWRCSPDCLAFQGYGHHRDCEDLFASISNPARGH